MRLALSRVTYGPSGHQEVRDRAIKLGYDVAVNLIGNLLTAAMVYLRGAAADLFPRNSYLITISVMVIAIGGAVLLLAADWGWELVTGKRPRFVLGIALALLGIA